MAETIIKRNTTPKPMPELTEREIAEFWKRVDKPGPDECWPWLGSKVEDGYGRLKIKRDGKKLEFKSNRLAYFIATGDDPGPHLRVLHSCDNPSCCNDRHLRKGTPGDNVRDRHNRGRDARGDTSGMRLHPERSSFFTNNPNIVNPPKGIRNGRAKVTEKQVHEIRALYDAGEREVRDIGRQFNISGTMVCCIGKRKFWSHIPDAIQEPGPQPSESQPC